MRAADPSPIADAVESSHAGADDAAPDRRAYDVSYAWADAAADAGPDAEAYAGTDRRAVAEPEAQAYACTYAGPVATADAVADDHHSGANAHADVQTDASRLRPVGRLYGPQPQQWQRPIQNQGRGLVHDRGEQGEQGDALLRRSDPGAHAQAHAISDDDDHSCADAYADT